MESLLFAAILIYSTLVLGLKIEENLNINNGTWLKAFRDCNRTRSHLPAYKVATDHKDIGLWMDQKMISTLWLSLNKTRFPTWMWLDNEPVDHEFSKQNWRDFMNCGVLHLRDKAIEVDRCSKNDLGYVCTSASVTSCIDGSFHQSDCTQFNQRVYVYGCGAENWYDARYRCKKDDMDLAIMRSEPLMRYLHHVWYKGIRKKCTKLWMGLRRNDWQYRGMRVQGQYNWQSFWGLGEPSERGSCAVISKREGSNDFKWYAENCNVVHSWFCIQPKRYQKSTAMIQVTKEYNRLSLTTGAVTQNIFVEGDTRGPVERSNVNAATIVLPIIVVLIIVAVVAFVVWWRRRPTKKKLPLNHEAVGLLFKQLTLPNSEIVLKVPKGMFEHCLTSDILRVEAYMRPESYKIPDDAKLLTPVVTVAYDLNEHDLGRNTAWLSIPHKLNITNMEKYISVYTQRPEGGEWRALKRGTADEGNSYEETAIIRRDNISVPVEAPVVVMCTCRREAISSMNLTAVLFSKYYEEKTLQEMNLKLYFIDSLYSTKDCIKTLDKEHDDYELIQVKPSAVREITGSEQVKIQFEVDGDWKIISPANGETMHQEIQALRPTSTAPVGVLVENWIIKREQAIRDDKESCLKISLRVHLLDRNDILCEYEHLFDSLQYEDDYQDEDS